MDPEDDSQIDEEERPDEIRHSLVGVPLVTPESGSNLNDDTPIDGPDDFM